MARLAPGGVACPNPVICFVSVTMTASLRSGPAVDHLFDTKPVLLKRADGGMVSIRPPRGRGPAEGACRPHARHRLDASAVRRNLGAKTYQALLDVRGRRSPIREASMGHGDESDGESEPADSRGSTNRPTWSTTPGPASSSIRRAHAFLLPPDSRAARAG